MRSAPRWSRFTSFPKPTPRRFPRRDLVILNVVIRVGPEGEVNVIDALQLDQKVGILTAKSLDHSRVDQHAEG